MTEQEWLASNDPLLMLRRLQEHVWKSNTFGDVNPALLSERKLRLWATSACRQAFGITGGITEESKALCELSDQYADGLIPYSTLEACSPKHADCSWPLRYDKNVHNTVMDTINDKAFLPGQAALWREIVGNPYRPVTFLKVGAKLKLQDYPTWRLVPARDGDAVAATVLSIDSKHMWVQPAHADLFTGEPSPPGAWPLWRPDWLTPQVASMAKAAYDERPSWQCRACWERVQRVARLMAGPNTGRDRSRECEEIAEAMRLCGFCHGGGRIADGTLDRFRLAILADALEDADCTEDDLVKHLRSPGPHVRGCWALDLLLSKS